MFAEWDDHSRTPVLEDMMFLKVTTNNPETACTAVGIQDRAWRVGARL
jgi:hypothetical protein